MDDCSEREEETQSRMMREVIEMQSRNDIPAFHKEKIRNLAYMMSSLSHEAPFSGNDKMCELMMERQLSSSVDDIPFCDNTVHIMDSFLYEAASDKNADADGFVFVLKQVCTRKEVDLATIFNHVTSTGDSLLHVAAQHGSKQVVCLIAFYYPKLLYKTNMKGDTPLHVAARAKNIVAIKNIFDMDKHFMTSKEAESMDKVELIMLRNNYGRTALHEAVLCKYYSVVLFLLVAHKPSDLTSYWTWNCSYGCKSPIYLAALIRAEDILDLLLRLIPIPSGKAISNGDSPLHAAISERNKDLLKMVVDTRQELLYQRDENNNTPLHYAAYAGYMEGVCIMLETSPMVSFQRNSNGNLPVHLACTTGNVDMVKKLLEIECSNAGISLNNKGQNIVHVAAMKGQTDLIKYLLKNPKIHYDAVNERDVNGDTPLHLASRELHLWTLLFLSRDKTIDVNIVNNEGLTARDVVRMQCRNPMTRQEFLTDAILERVGVPLKANMLGIAHTTSTNKEWNVKEASSTLILVAILIATVTFTAGFTVPGGFYPSEGSNTKQRGLAILSNQTLFKIFMAFNTISMYSSTIGSVILLWVPLGDLRFAEGTYGLAKMFVYVALIAMPVAFLAAIRLIVSNNTLLAHVVSVIGSISIFFIIFVRILGFFPLRNQRPVFRQIAGLLIRIIIVLFYGWTDIDHVGEVNQIAARSRNDEIYALDNGPHFRPNSWSNPVTDVHSRCCPYF